MSIARGTETRFFLQQHRVAHLQKQLDEACKQSQEENMLRREIDGSQM